MFHDLPDAKEYPDYYQAIKTPASFSCVRERIDDRLYNNAAEFMTDMELIFENAKFYNEKGSQIHDDAALLQVTYIDSVLVYKLVASLRESISYSGYCSYYPLPLQRNEYSY
ncbi:Bromodomain-containing protein [Dimargaris cristalligena]|uniref:Bromodomain-containing protein n=1 Tax=Dimargaris cristalligena TaxID=215637 RepID=A0A4P9ZR79_9FUNG|nr:Bromodomain-containing protein [Dimargaris cristalligena]|eukprot:RKP35897.1 Bromodomain-containing protein [Dimargaris cristalligena]